MSESDIVSYIQAYRPSAQFIRCVHSDQFDVVPDFPFYYVTLYDHEIDSSCIRSTRRGLILIENTYLASFSYNVLVAWLVTTNSPAASANQHALLKYNFKKFFAEQLLRVKNCVISRAIFLETLLFEQEAMIGVFDEMNQSTSLSLMIKQAVDTMTQITRLHELSHHFLNETVSQWDELLHQYPMIFQPVESLAGHVGPQLFTEVKCDVLAVLHDFQEKTTPEDRTNSLKYSLFGYACFCVMTSLSRSAESTIEKLYQTNDSIQLESLEAVGGMFDYKLELDTDFATRAKAVQSFCEGLAASENLNLYSHDTILTVTPTVLHDLLSSMQQMMDSDDDNARKMSLLVATALHDHPRGVEFLLQHSKKFQGKELSSSTPR